MEFFIDTAETEEIRKLLDTGLVDGVTTNPSLIAKSGRKINEVIKEIADMVDGPVSAEVISTETKKMIEEGLKLKDLADNIAVKVPLTYSGIEACYALSEQEIMVNVTLCFSAAQALLAAKAGAAFVSPFVGRLDDIGQNGMALIDEICSIYAEYCFDTEIIVASVRNPIHVVEAAKMGADIATVPPKVLHQLFNHPLTDKGVDAFLADWAKTGQDI
jgi:transaldolase